jgi:hypothetical protein
MNLDASGNARLAFFPRNPRKGRRAMTTPAATILAMHRRQVPLAVRLNDHRELA